MYVQEFQDGNKQEIIEHKKKELSREKKIWQFIMQWIHMRSLTYMKIEYMHFCLNQWKWGTYFVSENWKIIFKIQKDWKVF